MGRECILTDGILLFIYLFVNVNRLNAENLFIKFNNVKKKKNRISTCQQKGH